MSPADERELRYLLVKAWRRTEFEIASCSGKQGFDTPEDARKAMPKGTTKRHERPAVYRCPYCGRWHVGNKRRPPSADRRPRPDEEERSMA